MAQILQSLNQEWSAIADSPSARRALMRWSAAHPVFLPAADLDDVIDLGYRADIGAEVRRALATMAPTDHLAARTLLQELLGGLVNLAHRVGRDHDAVDDVVSLAWERIRTYPAHRPGSVSGNVLLDVRKRYRREQDQAQRCQTSVVDATVEPSAEERALSTAFVEELIAVSEGTGVSNEALSTIIRSRVAGESMADLAAEQQVSLKVLWHRRWRAEARLRELPLVS
jgi:DNA-directed RNA polymerase specialized sigma24 family protein